MKVLKFGGSSIASPAIIEKIKKIIMEQSQPCVVVVSAFKNITNKLSQAVELAKQKDTGYKTLFEEITSMHINYAEEVLPENTKQEALNSINDILNELGNILQGIYLLNDSSPKIKANVLEKGELLSSLIINYLIEGSVYFDSRELIKTNDDYESASVDVEESYKLIKEKIQGDKIFVVPGFIASNSKNETTLLGWEGSDYSAALFAAALNSEVLEKWTDVDGFMTADPKKVEKAFAIEKLSFSEAMELSHFGAKVIYSPAIQPVFKKGISIKVKNINNPEVLGTVISNEVDNSTLQQIKGISSIDNVNLITLQGSGVAGGRGISARLFGALAEKDINIVLITQSSSEYSITFAVSPEDTKKASTAIQRVFDAEIKNNEINVQLEENLSVIAIVGEGMKDTPGISANLFGSLGRNGISVNAMAQGSSELNISVVIKKESLKKALNVIHEGFFLSHYKDLHLFIAGIGNVGQKLIEQINHQQCELMSHQQLKINVIGVSNSRKMLINQDGIDLVNYRDQLDKNGEKADLQKLVTTIHELNLRNSVFVDCTASEPVSEIYLDLIKGFTSVVTANKIACSSEYSLYDELKKNALRRRVKFMYETNVGAGLPIINTINDLIRSGDKILGLEAVLSGTLNYIFNVLSEEIPMSKAILMAKENGYSEPDPRIDLSGIDVVRKILILAREAGYQLEQSDVEVNSFLPDSCFEGTLDDFWEKVKEYDEEFEQKRKELEKENKCWRFVAILKDGKPSVELKVVDSSHPAFSLEGSNNIILITTERYNEYPMVIRGYGAGADVTAAGVFADVIRVANI